MAHDTLLRRSANTRDLDQALEEWLYTGQTRDHVRQTEMCELCLEEPLRYHFLIANQRTDDRMWIGSDCIERFGILAVDESGVVLGREDSAAKVRRDRRKLVEDSRTRHVLAVLERLAKADSGFDAEVYRRQLGEHRAFAPGQAHDLMTRAIELEVEVAASMFRVTIRRQADREALLAMNSEQVRRIWRCLSADQRRLYTADHGPSQPV
jgi:hypothetical protein